jgi:purine-binding chemotaxis protein CheW
MLRMMNSSASRSSAGEEETMPAKVQTGISTYLTFELGSELFAVEVRSVREVLDSSTVTRMPRMPDYVRGVINLRGSVVPVVDLRLKFGMEAVEDSVDTCIIVMEISLDGESTVIGGLADSVKEVFDLDPGQIEPPPRIGTHLNTDFIRGMGKHEDRFVIILDIDKVFSGEELVLLDGEAREGADS